MWTIGQLKARGKACFQRNYWKAVLVALVVSLIGGMQGSGVIKMLFSCTANFVAAQSDTSDDTPDFGQSRSYQFGFRNDPFGGYGLDDDFGLYDNGFGNGSSNPFSGFSSNLSTFVIGLVVVFAVLVFFLLIILSVVAILLDVFIFNPLFIGTQRFFIHNLTADGMVGDMGFGFDRGYKNQVRVMFFRDLYTIGWSLLFLVPGIYKSYEYRMIPYLMAEYPQMSKEQAFYASRFLMQGNKGRAFLLDLSFIGWWLLSGVTLGLVGVFYANPYYVSTCAALYEALKAIKGIPTYDQPQPSFDPMTGEPAFAGAQGNAASQMGTGAGEPVSANAFGAQAASSVGQTVEKDPFGMVSEPASGQSGNTQTAFVPDEPVMGAGFVMSPPREEAEQAAPDAPQEAFDAQEEDTAEENREGDFTK